MPWVEKNVGTKLVRAARGTSDNALDTVQSALEKDLTDLKTDAIGRVDRNIQKLVNAQREATRAIREFENSVRPTAFNAPAKDMQVQRAEAALRAWSEQKYYAEKVRVLVATLAGAAAKATEDLDAMNKPLEEQSSAWRSR